MLIYFSIKKKKKEKQLVSITRSQKVQTSIKKNLYHVTSIVLVTECE